MFYRKTELFSVVAGVEEGRRKTWSNVHTIEEARDKLAAAKAAKPEHDWKIMRTTTIKEFVE